MNLKLIIIILIIIYIFCYFIFPSNIQILQTTIKDFNFSLLYTKQPIVISDYIEEKEKLVKSWFNYNFIKKIYYEDEDEDEDENKWIHNKYKYLFINPNDDNEIIIYKASIYSNDPIETDRIIVIKLEKNQSLIIPYKWKYYIKNKKNIEFWGINDPITFFLGLLF